MSGTDWWQFGASAASAAGTIGAVWAAVVFAHRDGERWQAEQRRRDEERRDAEAAQARLVIVETDLSGSANDPAKIKIINHSPWPIHDVELMSVLAVDKGNEQQRFIASRPSNGPVSQLQTLHPRGAEDHSDVWRLGLNR